MRIISVPDYNAGHAGPVGRRPRNAVCTARDADSLSTLIQDAVSYVRSNMNQGYTEMSRHSDVELLTEWVDESIRDLTLAFIRDIDERTVMSIYHEGIASGDQYAEYLQAVFQGDSGIDARSPFMDVIRYALADCIADDIDVGSVVNRL